MVRTKIAIAVLAALALAASASAAAPKRPFAHATQLSWVLQLRDGSTKTFAFAPKAKPARPLRGGVTGTVTVTYKDGSQRAFDYTRGVIVKLGDGAVVVRPVGTKARVTLRLGAATIVREQGKTVGVGDLMPKERAMFFSQNGELALVRCLKQKI